MALVELRDICKTFGSVKAADNVSIDIESGEFITLLGPSGSGKTTVLRIIAGFEEPDSGTVRLNGVDITHLPPFDRDVNTVFQDYALFPHMTVQDNVEYGLRTRKVPKALRAQQAGEAIASVKLEHATDRLPHQLSGVSVNGSHWLAPWCCDQKCCCSTNHSVRSTANFARRCRWS